MNVAVRYQSRGGHVRAIAESLADGAGVEAISVDDSRAPLTEYVDLLFIGGALYGFKLDPSLVDYIQSIPPDMVGKAVCFGSSALTRRPVYLIQELLKKRDVEIHPLALYQRGKPKPYLLEIAPTFAADEIAKYKKELEEGKDTEAPILKAIRMREEAKRKKWAEKHPEEAAAQARDAERKAAQAAADAAEEAAREAEEEAERAMAEAEEAMRKAERAKRAAQQAAEAAARKAAEAEGEALGDDETTLSGEADE